MLVVEEDGGHAGGVRRGREWGRARRAGTDAVLRPRAGGADGVQEGGEEDPGQEMGGEEGAQRIERGGEPGRGVARLDGVARCGRRGVHGHCFTIRL